MFYTISSYFAPVSHYAAMLREGSVVVEQFDHYVKQTLRNRQCIVGPNGVQTLSIPVQKPDTPKAYMRDIRISDHGNWRHLHWNALVASYGKSPFFEYYADDIRPFYESGKTPFLVDFNEEILRTMLRLLDMEEVDVRRTDSYQGQAAGASSIDKPVEVKTVPYYQVFQARHGFTADLSILDLLFNMGPESLIVLHNMNPALK